MTNTLYMGDCLEILPTLEANSIDLILTDPPYFKVKNEAWDRQWDNRSAFIAWLGKVADEWQRVLKPNGSVYVFASPQMAWHVEGMMRERFNVLNNIRWQKPPFATKAEMFVKEDLRCLFPASENIIFAEHYGADNIARGESGYAAKCDELRGFIFEPLRTYLDGERQRAGVTVRQVAEAFQRKTGSRTVTGMAGHWFSDVQWTLPTKENYEWLRQTLSQLNHSGDYLRKEYEDLRKEYEDLRKEYEDLRRPFNATPDAPYTDVWTFPTVSHYKGKHPCEKPAALLEHAIQISTRPGATVLDCFMGHGSTGKAAKKLQRHFVGIEKDGNYFQVAKQGLEQPQAQSLFAEVAT
jgi:adenine-specific DNA-methyltransferase